MIYKMAASADTLAAGRKGRTLWLHTIIARGEP